MYANITADPSPTVGPNAAVPFDAYVGTSNNIALAAGTFTLQAGHAYLAIYTVGAGNNNSFRFARGVAPGVPNTLVPGTLTSASNNTNVNHTTSAIIDLRGETTAATLEVQNVGGEI